jgi:hypothetical protein
MQPPDQESGANEASHYPEQANGDLSETSTKPNASLNGRTISLEMSRQIAP